MQCKTNRLRSTPIIPCVYLMPHHAAPHTVQESIVDMKDYVFPGQHIAYELNDELTDDDKVQLQT
jgi:hypothetical protein